ncbi:Gfo/Idh/MocA family oxidoreductase [Carboxydochorda subterranea]|uniref:Gfo/Idh/MocA family oxidoreductase n=1 Tax=Carboxydichorda subterranea TaxID=3109565 RepID=A0ABZ1BWT6_9FIRM|nr:Gfo/Idh/MocA family oxidoreductase [Limnochorda sp. L945t]WRP16573.1 Gfo/Idh/MocA family oxidoreductase [Limnochorda sp. L945t]
MLQVGLVGTGIISREHVRAIAHHPQCTLVGVADVVSERARQAAEQYRRHRACAGKRDEEPRPFASAAEMLGQLPLDVVVVAVPHGLHEEVAIAALRAGAHVFVEKPLAPTRAACDAILEEAAKMGRQVAVGHVMRYFPEIRTAREVVAAGTIGAVVSVVEVRHAEYFVNTRPRWFFDRELAGGGVLMTQGVHSVDKVQFVTGRRVLRVSGRAWYREDLGLEVAGGLWLELDGGVTATIVQSGYRGAPRHEIEVIGTRGRLRAEWGHGVSVTTSDAGYEPVPLHDGGGDPYQAQWDAFVASLLEGREVPVPGTYGRQVVSVIEAFYASSRTGGSWVSIET